MKKLIYTIIAVATLSSCYEYQKLPNTKRVKKRDVKKAMKSSSSEYYQPHYKNYQTSFQFNP